MTHHIFPKSGELFLIMEKVSERPNNLCSDFIGISCSDAHNCNCNVSTIVYQDTISRLKDSAIRVSNAKVVLGEYTKTPNVTIEGFNPFRIHDELHPIECEAEIKTEPCERDYCWIHERCEFDYENNGSIKSCGVKKTAILKPSRQEPHEDDEYRVPGSMAGGGLGK